MIAVISTIRISLIESLLIWFKYQKYKLICCTKAIYNRSRFAVILTAIAAFNRKLFVLNFLTLLEILKIKDLKTKNKDCKKSK